MNTCMRFFFDFLEKKKQLKCLKLLYVKLERIPQRSVFIRYSPSILWLFYILYFSTTFMIFRFSNFIKCFISHIINVIKEISKIIALKRTFFGCTMYPHQFFLRTISPANFCRKVMLLLLNNEIKIIIILINNRVIFLAESWFGTAYWLWMLKYFSMAFEVKKCNK